MHATELVFEILEHRVKDPPDEDAWLAITHLRKHPLVVDIYVVTDELRQFVESAANRADYLIRLFWREIVNVADALLLLGRLDAKDVELAVSQG